LELEALVHLAEHLLLDLLFRLLEVRVALQLSELAGLALAETLITSVVAAPLTIPLTMVDQVARLVYSVMAEMAETLRLFLLVEMLAVVVMLAAAAAWAFLGFQQQYYQHLPWTLSQRGMALES
jgi:hypothetical protein